MKCTLTVSAKLTLKPEDKAKARIHDDACTFACSYPVEDYCKATLQKHTRGDLTRQRSLLNAAAELTKSNGYAAFLIWGGYIYFDQHEEIVQAMAAYPSDESAVPADHGMLRFGEPRPYKPDPDDPTVTFFQHPIYSNVKCAWVPPGNFSEHGGFVVDKVYERAYESIV